MSENIIEPIDAYKTPDGYVIDAYGKQVIDLTRNNFNFLIDKVNELIEAVNMANQEIEELKKR